MSTVTIILEIGHDSSLRTKTTPEGFTHDWEVFVRGCNGADIKQYVDRVVFHLHETFEKPKRVVKEPPYSVRTSGYAGFNLPINVYLKNAQEPKKIQFNYDLQLQPNGPPIHKVQKEKYTFYSVGEDFRNKLLKGGALVGSSGTTENTSNNYPIKSEEKLQMTSKPKLGGSDQPKKYKLKPEESRCDQFTDLFGTPITKTSRVPEVPKIKETTKPAIKSGDKDKGDKISDKNKTKSPHKDKERDRDKEKDKDKARDKPTENISSSDKKVKDEKKDKKDKKERETSRKDKKDRKEREKEKERDKSPQLKSKSPSPKRSPKRARSPSPVKSSSKEKEPPKDKEAKESREKDREKEKKSKKHKEKESKHRDKEKERDKERDRERSGDRVKEHKNKDGKSGKDKEKENSSGSISNSTAGKEKERDVSPMVNTQSQKPEKREKTKEIKEPEKVDEIKSTKDKDREKNEDKPKHKHKKKDKDRKEKKDKEEKSSHKKEKEEKRQEKEKISSASKDTAKEISLKEREKTDNLFGSSPKSEPPSPTPLPETAPEKIVAVPDDDSSNGSKLSSRESSPIPQILHPAPPPPKSPSPSPILESPKKPSQEESLGKKGRDVSAATPNKKREKKERKKDKKGEKDNEKKRKRKVEAETQVEIEQPPPKVEKKAEDTNNNSDDERKVSSTEDANLIPYKDDGEAYMSMLRELQHKIMGLKDNSDLQKVVQLIAETGRYEVSAHTFDFDLCLLDRSTVMQLQAFFSSVN